MAINIFNMEEKKDKERNYLISTSLISAVIAIILSITALCRCQPFVFTESWLIWAVGVSTSILSIAIASAIAIQVYNSVVSESRLKRIINDKVTENENHLNSIIEDVRKEFLSLLDLMQSKNFLIEKQYESTLDLLICSLVRSKDCSYKTAYNTAIQALNGLIKIIEVEKINFSIEKQKQLWYKKEIAKINDKQIVEIEKFIKKVETRIPDIPNELCNELEPFKKQTN